MIPKLARYSSHSTLSHLKANCTASCRFSEPLTSPAATGPLTITPDGAVYTEVLTSTSMGACGPLVTIQDQDPKGICLGCTSYYLGDLSYSSSLRLLRIGADGSTQLLPLHSYSVAGVGNVSINEHTSLREAIPDGSGAVLAAWDLAVTVAPNQYQYITKITHITSGG